MKKIKVSLFLCALSLFSISVFAAENSLANKTGNKIYHITCYTPSGSNFFESDVKDFNIPVASFVTVITTDEKTVRLSNAVCKIEDK